MNQEQRDFNVLDLITVLSLWLQIAGLDELHRQASSDDIYEELRKQDREYLSRIVDNQKVINEKLDLLLAKVS